MSEHDFEAVHGLPGRLPAGERILWRGSPDPRLLAAEMFHLRLLAAYFGAIALVALATGSLFAVAAALASGVAAGGVLAAIGWAQARTTVYTLTDRRVVMRIGVALPACFNLPLKLVGGAALHPLAGGRGDIALAMTGKPIGWLYLWPHVRPWRLRSPEPMLRAVPDAAAVAGLLADACAALGPIERATSAAVHEGPTHHPAGVAA